MNKEETLALWRQGKRAWTEWASRIADKRKALERAGQWSADWFGEGQNTAAKAWLEEAAADFSGAELAGEADFSGLQFPGPADFDDAKFGGAANFAGTRFAGNVSFENTRFAAGANWTGAKFLGFSTFDGTHFAEVSFAVAEFLKENRDLLAPAVRFHRVQFQSTAVFSGTRFAGAVEFVRAAFTDEAQFDAAEFQGGAMFKAARFGGAAGFTKARFAAQVDFSKAVFSGAARFGEAHFGGSGGELMISGAGAVNFAAAQFEDEAAFQQAWFVGESEFNGARFGRTATFTAASFVMPASFGGARFPAGATFRDAHFVRGASFGEARFAGPCDFSDASIGGEASFAGAQFAGQADFSRTVFAAAANFHAATGDAAIVLEGTHCAEPPDFGEASFKEPPALDKLVLGKQARRKRSGGPQPVIRPMLMRWFRAAPRPDMAAHYRRLRDLAAAQPPVQTPENNVVELRPQRAAAEGREMHQPAAASPGTGTLQPEAAVPAAKAEVPRLLLRPFLAWATTVAGFACFYIRQRPDTVSAGGAPGHLPGPPAVLSWGPDWLNTAAGWIWLQLDDAFRAILEMFSTGPCLQGSSSPVGEAFYLSLKNATLLAGAENEQVTRRVYGCLYGMDGAAPVLPLAVSLASIMQTVLSAVLIFLFFTALARRMMRK